MTIEGAAIGRFAKQDRSVKSEGADDALRVRGLPLQVVQVDATAAWRGAASDLYCRFRMPILVTLACIWGALLGSGFWLIMQMVGVHFGAKP